MEIGHTENSIGQLADSAETPVYQNGISPSCFPVRTL